MEGASTPHCISRNKSHLPSTEGHIQQNAILELLFLEKKSKSGFIS